MEFVTTKREATAIFVLTQLEAGARPPRRALRAINKLKERFTMSIYPEIVKKAFSMSRQNDTFWPKVGDMGVGYEYVYVEYLRTPMSKLYMIIYNVYLSRNCKKSVFHE